jgi:hypothetical protein
MKGKIYKIFNDARLVASRLHAFDYKLNAPERYK